MAYFRGDGYHTPIWPAYIPKAGKPRVLAYLDESHTLHTEYGEVIQIEPFSWESLSHAIYSQDMHVWCDEIALTLREMLPAILDEYEHKDERKKAKQQWSEPILDPESGQRLIGIVIHRGRYARHINLAGRWGWMIYASEPQENAAWLSRLRWLFDTLGTGVRGTPGSVGATAMQQHFDKPGMKRHHRPWLECIAALEKHAIGGRNELYAEPGIIHDVVWKVDHSGAYPSYAGKLPAGKLLKLSGRDNNTERLLFPYDGSAPRIKCSTWFARCMVRIDAPGIPAGDVLPFGYKQWSDESQRYEVHWPTTPGYYGHYQEVWLWREEAEALIRRRREEGAPVLIPWMGEAYVWETWTEELVPWQEQMEAARKSAPTPQHAKLVKQCSNAGIGRLGIPYEGKRLISYREATPDDPVWELPGLQHTGSKWCVRTERTDPGTPKHWQSYVIMRCNLTMSQHMHQYYLETGRAPLSCTVDEMDVPTEPAAKYQGTEWKLGGWKSTALHDWVGYGPGHIHSLEEQRMPGVPDWKKQRLYRWGERGSVVRGRKQRTEAQQFRGEVLTSARFRLLQQERIAPFYAEALRHRTERKSGYG